MPLHVASKLTAGNFLEYNDLWHPKQMHYCKCWHPVSRALFLPVACGSPFLHCRQQMYLMMELKVNKSAVQCTLLQNQLRVVVCDAGRGGRGAAGDA